MHASLKPLCAIGSSSAIMHVSVRSVKPEAITFTWLPQVITPCVPDLLHAAIVPSILQVSSLRGLVAELTAERDEAAAAAGAATAMDGWHMLGTTPLDPRIIAGLVVRELI